MLVTAESGRIESDALIELTGAKITVAGTVDSTGVTAATDDFEFKIAATETASVTGQVIVAGSALVSGPNHVSLYDATLRVTGAGERLEVNSNGDIDFGLLDNSGAIPVQLGGILEAPASVAINAGGDLNIDAGVLILATEDQSQVSLTGDSVTLTGAVYGGGKLDLNDELFWYGREAVVTVTASSLFETGGVSVDIAGDPVAVGGNLIATGSVDINVTQGSVMVNTASSIRTDSTAEGLLANPLGVSSIQLTASDTIQVHGLIESLDLGSDVTLTAGSLVTINGLAYAADALHISGGDSDSDVSVYVTEFIFLADQNGVLLDDQGRLMNESGQLIDADGNLVDENGDPSATPVSAGAPVRLSGGTVNTGANGSIDIVGTEAVLLNGLIGQSNNAGGGWVADVDMLTVTTTGDVFVGGSVDIAQSIVLSGANISVMPQASVIAREITGEIEFLAPSGAILILNGGDVEAAALIHLFSNSLNLDGSVAGIDALGRVLLNVVSNITISGDVTAVGQVDIHAGVGPAWTPVQLRASDIDSSQLTGGSIGITGDGKLHADGHIRLITDAGVLVQSEAILADGQRPELTPVISNEPAIISVVTGARTIADGFILVPEIHWVDTQVIEQIGTETVRIGTVFRTMDIELEQDGYWNGDTQTKREWFIEEVDYRNEDIDWTNLETPDADFTFNQLNDLQRERVLDTLGFMKLFVFSYANPQEHRVINGQPSVSVWNPDWANNDEVIVNLVDVEVLADKWVQLPEGALNDLLRLVAQGTADVTQEDVGVFWDTARVLYTQDRSNHVAEEINGLSTIDFDNSIGRWAVTYDANGLRNFTINDGRVGLTLPHVPLWDGAANSEEGFDPERVLVLSPEGYLTTSEALLNQELSSTLPNHEVGLNPNAFLLEGEFPEGEVGVFNSDPGDFSAPSYFKKVGGVQSQSIDGLDIPEGYRVTVFSGSSYNGTPIDLTGPVQVVADSIPGFNSSTISSMWVWAPDQVIFFEEDWSNPFNYDSFSAGVGSFDSSTAGYYIQNVEEIYVPDGLTIELYDNDSYSSSPYVVTGRRIP